VQGVEGIGFSQFFGFDPISAQHNDWKCSKLPATANPFCGYPCLSSLDWNDGAGNPRWYVLKLLVSALGGSTMKSIAIANIVAQPAAAAASREGEDQKESEEGECELVGTELRMDFAGGDLCEFNMSSAPSATTCAQACCATRGCLYFVTVAPSSSWAPRDSRPCSGHSHCFTGGSCCYLKDNSTKSVSSTPLCLLRCTAHID
jgi:hypothetical protein